jgi:hypothetical protein
LPPLAFDSENFSFAFIILTLIWQTFDAEAGKRQSEKIQSGRSYANGGKKQLLRSDDRTGRR